ncbi:hypothetical protein EHLJMEHL_04348 [Vreelandella titanicae]
MPPLLPEYLSQPLHFFTIHIQEAPHMAAQSTDWWALVAAGLFTLVGAAVGAWYGGRSAYQNTVKAQNDSIKRKKLEEALTILLSLEGPARTLSTVVALSFGSSKESIGLDNQRLLSKLDSGKSSELMTLLQLYCKRLHVDSVELNTQLTGLKTMAFFSKALAQAPEPAFFEAVPKVVELVELMKKELISELSL